MLRMIKVTSWSSAWHSMTLMLQGSNSCFILLFIPVFHVLSSSYSSKCCHLSLLAHPRFSHSISWIKSSDLLPDRAAAFAAATGSAASDEGNKEKTTNPKAKESEIELSNNVRIVLISNTRKHYGNNKRSLILNSRFYQVTESVPNLFMSVVFVWLFQLSHHQFNQVTLQQTRVLFGIGAVHI